MVFEIERRVERDMKIGYIGLGRMGRGMALNILRGGHDLIVYDASATAMTEVVAAGAKAASDIADLPNQGQVIFTSLPGPPEVEQDVLGDGGLIHHMRPGQTLFDTSTSSRELALRMHGRLAQQGVVVLDAPVSGGPAGAASGDMAFWIGGDETAYEKYLPLLRCMGDKPRLCGPIGSGTIVKLVNNLAGQMILSTMAEVFSVGVKAGIDPLDLWEALKLGAVGKHSPLNMLTGQFLPAQYDPPAFALRLSFKDIDLATEMGRELGVPMRLAGLVYADMLEGLGRGWGDLDSRSYLQLQLDRAGVTIAVDPDRIAAAQRTGDS
jgi:3-hydroxyisobutyrate dehydrogenase